MSIRTRYIISSLVITISLPIMTTVGNQFDVPVNVLIGVWLVISVFGMLYIIEREYRFPEQLIFAILPFLHLITMILLGLHYELLSITTVSLFWGAFYMISAFVLYFLFLILNIINTATVRTVPLLKAAQSSVLGLSLILGILWAIYIQSSVNSVELAAWLWLLLSFFITIALVYLAQVEVVREFTSVISIPVAEAFAVSLLQGYTVLVTSGWYMTVALRTIYWVSSLAIFIMLMRARKQRKLTRRSLREFSILQWVIFAAVIIGGIRFG